MMEKIQSDVHGQDGFVILYLRWNWLGIRPNEKQFMLVDGEGWRLNLELLPLAINNGKAGEKKRKKNYKFRLGIDYKNFNHQFYELW